MSAAAIQILLEQWTGENEWEAVDTVTLERYAQDFPYSPGVQLLLTKKYQHTNHPSYLAQLKKTAPFFPSALHLHQSLLEESGNGNEVVAEQKLNTVLTEQLAQFNEPLVTEKLEFEIETPIQMDYFAAQGIEIDLSKVPQDKFTKQLRSFTAWLKVLKQADLVENTTQIAEDQEKIITAIAEKANKAEDIITESMAEIWAKQGNKRKAIDTYSKLSFIFPEKSVYFASRIEQLKQKK